MYVIFYLHLHSTFTIHVRNLITVEASCFIKSQLRNRCSKYLSSESMHAWTHQIMDCRTLSTVWRWSPMVWQTSEMRWQNVPSFSIAVGYRWGF